jgi:4-amino-4-deoxy-L-arabinose transferase-like glycosyltransferase
MALQETVRDIDSGTTAKFLKIGMITLIIIGMILLYFMVQFRGLANESAMDQAQIARSLISGEGFTTRYIRPLAIRVLSDLGKPTDKAHFPEFYNAPLMPMLDAAVLFPVKNSLQMSPTETLSMGDRVLAALGIVLLFAGIFVWYRVALLIFDQTLALIAAGLLLVTDLMWQYALSGLPQLFLILLFGLVTFCAVQAKKSDDEEIEPGDHSRRTLLWLSGSALALGLMSLTHGVTAFLLPGYLAFIILGFHARITSFLLTLAIYLLTVSPWLIHNIIVCHNPFGLTIYLALAGAGITESEVMRGVNTGLALGGGLATKFKGGFMDQGAHLWEYLGLNLAAIFFLPSIMHPFRSPMASLWRWIILIMWFSMTVGMTLFGVKGAISGNQLHLLFLPIFVIYGTAFLLVLWNRLNFSLPALRIIFLTGIFLISGAPMILTLLAGQQARIQWPPYVPPFISVLGKWFEPHEVLCSDMPWGVAWYANRKCLLLPESIHAFDEISDYGTLGTSIVGLYLTPISGQEDFMTLVKGPYKDWGPVIMRTISLENFALKSFTPLPIDGECILYADSDRWARKSTQSAP